MVNMKNAKYGGFWIRVVAAIMDSIIIGIPTSIVGYGLAFATGLDSMVYLGSLAALVITIWMDGMKGGTPGKLLLGLNIVNPKGEFIGIPNAILRYVCKIISALVLLIGYFMIAFTKKKQGLHDILASTYVVYVKK